jgi:hypothetical protein
LPVRCLQIRRKKFWLITVIPIWGPMFFYDVNNLVAIAKICEAIIPQGKDWVDLFSALLMPAIAVVGIVITTEQARINRARFQHERFDRRYIVFEGIATFFAKIIQNGTVSNEELHNFLVSTRTARFIFGKWSKNYVEMVYKKALKLHTLDEMLKGIPVGEKRKQNLDQQEELHVWINSEFGKLEEKFSPYLELGD